MSLYIPAPRLRKRQKLGLSLAGGGFRASLFHVGVLLRLAEMDVLRYVEVLSTVSGGSIVGALYVLMLKQRLDTKCQLTRDEYVALVMDLRNTFVKGIQRDLRTRLFMNPFGMFSVLVSHDSLGRRMGRIYQRCLYNNAVNELKLKDRPSWLSRLLWPGKMALPKLRFKRDMPNGIEDYNANATSAGGSAVTQFIMNATSLNSGAPFRLSSNEIGDPRLGYFRYDEIKYLLARKELLELPAASLKYKADRDEDFTDARGINLSARTVQLAQWWFASNHGQKLEPPKASGWSIKGWGKLSDPEVAKAAYAMCRTNFGRLRQLKLPAWYLLIGYTRSENERVKGGFTEREHRERFNQVLEEIEPTIASSVLDEIKKGTADDLLDFALQIYYLRSAEVMSWRLKEDFDGISLGTAVAASANFPPVFTPLILLGIYDDLHVSRLGLSDGGVYDNMGIGTLLEEGCTDIIASDTGAPFEVQERISPGYVGMIARLPDILMDDVADQQRSNLRTRARLYNDLDVYLAPFPYAGSARDALKRKYGLEGLAFFSVDSLNPTQIGGIELGGCDPQKVACLRTDLDAFGDIEVSALINTGYDHADRFMKAYLNKPPYTNSYWSDPIQSPCTPTDRYKSLVPRVLEVGRSRFFRSLKIYSRRSLPSWMSIAIALALVVYFGRAKWSLQELINKIPSAIISWLEDPFPLFTRLERWFPRVKTISSFLQGRIESVLTTQAHLWALVFAAAALLLLIFLVWPWVIKRFRASRSPGKRKTLTVFKWARAFAPALFLVAGLTPVWLAIAACIIGWLSFLCFNLPFLWATKMD
jgi:predicted acylesterase/phospholipase RssA